MVRLPYLVIVLALVGCSGSPNGGISAVVGISTAPYLVLDLASGKLESRVEIADLTANSQWRTTRMVFRRLPTTSGAVGAPGADLGTDLGDASQSVASVGVTFLAVFETTQAQWTALGGTPTWLDPDIRAPGGDVIADGAPAFGISHQQALTVCAAYSQGRHLQVGLPSGTVWEVACRAGSTGTFAWGEALDVDSVRAYAAVFETQAGVTGPRQADGARMPNAYGYFDLHGNVWEWLAETDVYGDGLLCGGSWNDTVPLARCSNRVPLDPVVAHPLVGVRLVLKP
ncbi:MAG TPA: SUMF1/EgtB/PvdO family nonheme iron enzyme [Planctomycetota bacterium]|nr:SUMF1/EgtB/PvdO family nonheme iron enzyme [Planctomycetota bacterium]